MASEDERHRSERAARARERAERRNERERAASAERGRTAERESARESAPPEERPRRSARAPSPEPGPAAPKRSSAGGRLSDAWARRIAAGLLLLAGLVAALAILDVGPFSDPPTDEELATSAVESFYSAASAGDWERFCGALTEYAQTQVETNVARLTGDEPGGCIAALSSGGNSFEGLEIRIRDVNVVGTKARVETAVKLPDEPPELRSVLLVEENGDWLVNDPG